MLLAKSVGNVPIRLTKERWGHIISCHPEMKEQRDKVLETVRESDYVQKGNFDAWIAVKSYPDTPLTEKYLAVINKELILRGPSFEFCLH